MYDNRCDHCDRTGRVLIPIPVKSVMVGTKYRHYCKKCLDDITKAYEEFLKR